jgi:hypothetical protein
MPRHCAEWRQRVAQRFRDRAEAATDLQRGHHDGEHRGGIVRHLLFPLAGTEDARAGAKPWLTCRDPRRRSRDPVPEGHAPQPGRPSTRAPWLPHSFITAFRTGLRGADAMLGGSRGACCSHATRIAIDSAALRDDMPPTGTSCLRHRHEHPERPRIYHRVA